MADDLDLDDIDPDEHDNPNVVRQLRDMAKRSQQQAREGEAAKRELAFLKAGVDTSTPAGQIFARGYDGKLDDTDAMKALWAAIAPAQAPVAPPAEVTPPAGEVTPPPTDQPTDQTPPPAEQTGSQQRQELNAGAPPAGAQTGNRREQLIELALDARQKGDWDHAAGGLINGIAQAYRDGEIHPLGRDGRRIGE